MREPTFPKPVSEVVATLVELFRHQSRREIVDLLENAHAYFEQIEFDNWNGGTYYWALRLQVPVHIFAGLERQLPEIEKEIVVKLTYFDREYPNDHLNGVSISPITVGTPPLGQRMAPSEVEIRRLWGDGRFRLFVSHVSTHRVAAASLKEALWLRGIHAFVAHEDIEPILEFQDEIELALRSMHAFVALITSNFHASDWTDQEIGWALGRGVVVLPVKLERDPYGLIKKYQALPGRLAHPKKLAAQIAARLLANRQTHGEMRRAVMKAFGEATSPEMVKALCPLLVSIDDIAAEERASVWQACIENVHVKDDDEVCGAIHRAFGVPPSPQASGVMADEIPF